MKTMSLKANIARSSGQHPAASAHIEVSEPAELTLGGSGMIQRIA
jgi:hypothetical protein